MSSNTTSRNVAVIGLGAMGGAMAGTLARAGWNVLGYDPAPEAQRRAEQNGIATTAQLSDAAGTAYIVLSLPSASIVEQTVPVLLNKPGTLAVLDTSTSEPTTSEAMAALAQRASSEFIDAPVSGGPAGAAAGTLSAFVGGSTAALAAAQPVLETLTGGKYKHIGAVGSGNVVKLLNNMLCSVNLAAVAEAMDVAAAYGIDLGNAVDALNNATGASHVSKRMFPDWVLPGAFNSGFTMGLMARDVALALDISRQAGAEPRMMETTNALWQEALGQLGPAADFTRSTTVFTTSTSALNDEQTRNVS